MSGGIGARNYSTALLSDANLRFPRGEVRINPGVRIDVTPDALVISGPGGRQLLRCGSNKGTLVARLLQQGLVDETGRLDLNAIDHKIVGLLHAGGALEAVPQDPVAAEATSFTPLVGYLAGSRDSSRRFASGHDLAQFFAGQTVHIAATGQLQAIAEFMSDSGATVVNDTIETVLEQVGFDGAHVLIDRFLDPRMASDFCVAHIPEHIVDGHKVAPGWLLVGAVAGSSIVRLALRTDRWFQNAPDLCDTCIQRILDQVIDEAHDLRTGDLRTASALFAQELIDLAAQINQRPSDTALRAISGGNHFDRDIAVLEWIAQEPPCDDCESSPERGHRSQVTSYAVVSEFAERHVQDPKGHQAHYLDTNLAAQARPRVTSVGEDGTDARWDGYDTGEALAPTLEAVRYAVGIRPSTSGPKVSRFTASGGNMGSTSVVVEYTTSDGETKHLLYNDQADRFVDVASGRPPAEAPIPVETPRIHLIAGIGRLGPKYGHLAYRVALADAGAALATVQEYARANGLYARTDWATSLPDEIFSSVLVGEGRLAVTVDLVKGAN